MCQHIWAAGATPASLTPPTPAVGLSLPAAASGGTPQPFWLVWLIWLIWLICHVSPWGCSKPSPAQRASCFSPPTVASRRVCLSLPSCLLVAIRRALMCSFAAGRSWERRHFLGAGRQGHFPPCARAPNQATHGVSLRVGELGGPAVPLPVGHACAQLGTTGEPAPRCPGQHVGTAHALQSPGTARSPAWLCAAEDTAAVGQRGAGGGTRQQRPTKVPVPGRRFLPALSHCPGKSSCI